MPKDADGRYATAAWRSRGTYLLLVVIWMLAVTLSGWLALQWHHSQAERAFLTRFQELARELDASLNVNAAVMEGAAALVGAHHRLKRPALRHQLRELLRRFPHVQALRVYVASRRDLGPRLLVHETVHTGADNPWAARSASHSNLQVAVAQALDAGDTTASGPIPANGASAGYALVRRVYGDGLRMAVVLIVGLPETLVGHESPGCRYHVGLVHEAAPPNGDELSLYERGQGGVVSNTLNTLDLRRQYRFSASGQPFRLDARCSVGWETMDGGLIGGLAIGAAGGLLLALGTGASLDRRRRDKVQAQERLFYLANFDTVTGLPNRNLLLDRLGQAIARAHRSERPLVLLYMDMDGFKAVNDSAGHDAGDDVLRQIARRLSGLVREQDTVGRLSGDEFVVLLEDLEYPGLVNTVVRKIQDAMAAPFHYDGLTFLLGVSIGTAHYPSDGSTASELLQTADMAMYAEKHPENWPPR